MPYQPIYSLVFSIMLITYRNLLALLSAIVCLCLYRTWKRLRAFRHKERLYNCQRPSRYPHLDPIWGYDLHRLRRRAAKEGRFYKLYDTHFKAFGKTFEENFFGRTVINTIEPENIQKVAIDAFEDWGKVDSRNSASSPVLGSGIFSQDGLAWKHSRELIKPTFARAEIANLVPLASYTDQLLELMPKDGRTIDIQPLLHRFVSCTLFLLPSSHPRLLKTNFFMAMDSSSTFQQTFCLDSRSMPCFQTLHSILTSSSKLSILLWQG